VIDRETLIRQIEEYHKFKMMARELKRLEGENLGTFFRGQPEDPGFSYEDFINLSDAKVFDLLLAFQKIINRKAKKTGYFLEGEVYHIDDQVEWILGLLADRGQLEFNALFGENDSRQKLVTTFLAVLELVRIGQIAIQQESHFGELWIHQQRRLQEGSPPAGPESRQPKTSEAAPEITAAPAPAPEPAPHAEVKVIVQYQEPNKN